MSVVCDLLCETGFGVFRHGFAVEVAPNDLSQELPRCDVGRGDGTSFDEEEWAAVNA